MLISSFWFSVVAYGARAAVLAPAGPGYINYTAVTGYFLQDELSTNATTFDYTAENFGLINRTYPATEGLSEKLTQWQKFERQVDALNAAAPLNTVYKVIFLGRHGEGYHNAAQDYYGTPAWNCYWAMLTGNGTVVWDDAHLTPDGVAEAQVAHQFWQHEIEVQHIPYPQSYYSSPLTRCVQTANVTFVGLDLPEYYPFVPTIKELFRESIDLHTCDHRSNKSYIHSLIPNWKFEPGFTFYDELWNGVTAETNSAQVNRSNTVLDEVFTVDDHTWISVTSHSGEIAAILEAIGHIPFPLNTGAVIPVLVEAKFLPESSAPSTSVQPWTTSTWCHNRPPVTSISTLSQGCECYKTTAPLPTLSTQTPYSATLLPSTSLHSTRPTSPIGYSASRSSKITSYKRSATQA